MALTTTEENQLRELLRRANATQNGKTADQLDLRSGGEFDFLITSKGSSISRTGATDLGVKLAGANIGTSGTNLTTANSNYNHLMTRDATRSEITRLTDSRISSAQGTADLAVTANNATLRFAQTTEQRALAKQGHRSVLQQKGRRHRQRVQRQPGDAGRPTEPWQRSRRPDVSIQFPAQTGPDDIFRRVRGLGVSAVRPDSRRQSHRRIHPVSRHLRWQVARPWRTGLTQRVC